LRDNWNYTSKYGGIHKMMKAQKPLRTATGRKTIPNIAICLINYPHLALAADRI
jgi:hypothetical protein